VECILSQLDLGSTHTIQDTQQDNCPVNELRTAPLPHSRRSPLDLYRPKGLVILQQSHVSPLHPKWDAIIRNNLRHLPAAQQASHFMGTEQAAPSLLRSPSFPEILLETADSAEGQESSDMTPAIGTEIRAPSGQPVVDGAIIGSNPISNRNSLQPVTLLFKGEGRLTPSDAREYDQHVTIGQGSSKQKFGAPSTVKRRLDSFSAALQNHAGTHIITAEETPHSNHSSDGAPAAKRQRVDSSLVTFHRDRACDAVDQRKGRDGGDSDGIARHRDQKNICLEHDRPASSAQINGKSPQASDSTKRDETDHHLAIKQAPTVLFSQANRWQVTLKEFKRLEENGKISSKVTMALEGQLMKIDELKEGVTREVLQHSKLAKAVRVFAHKTAYGAVIREKARSLLDFFSRRYVGRPLCEAGNEVDRSS